MRIDGFSGLERMLAPPGPTTGKTQNFQDMLLDSMADVNKAQLNAENLIQRQAAGEAIEVEDLVNAVTKADLAFRTMIQVRNKLVEAFNELRQMQI